ncbi:unnamed protein product [Diabrotica balteata]|uniref:Uncharacterized protein n=1 Tax=Diabrotica balteata TaxID=107213 RepID=A0A9N9SVN4_DIABA|nr:unnamed protein product [Diabrotica balteata]
MKSKQKFSVSEKNLLKRQSLDNYSPLDFRTSRKISSNPLIQKNINFLRAYSNFLGRQSYGNTGNVDSYFKQSLRREPFNLIRDLQLTNLVRSTSSFESVSQTFNRRKRSRRTILKPRKILEFPHKSEIEPKKSEEFSVKELFLTNNNNNWESESDSGVNPDFSTGDNNFLSQHSDFQSHPLEKVEETLEEDDNAADARKDKTSIQDIDKLNDRLDILLKTAMNVMVEDDREKEGEEEGEGEGADMEEKIAEGENEDDELKEVEAMIERASKELAEVADENQKILETLEEGDEEVEKTEEDAKETQKTQEIKYNEATDHAVLKELEDAERQAIQTANIISKLKEQVTILSKKETMTERKPKNSRR